MKNNNNPKDFFWKKLGENSAKRGIDPGNPEKDFGIIPFVSGIVNSFF
jgi:hypothetical protein